MICALVFVVAFAIAAHAADSNNQCILPTEYPVSSPPAVCGATAAATRFRRATARGRFAARGASKVRPIVCAGDTLLTHRCVAAGHMPCKGVVRRQRRVDWHGHVSGRRAGEAGWRGAKASALMCGFCLPAHAAAIDVLGCSLRRVIYLAHSRRVTTVLCCGKVLCWRSRRRLRQSRLVHWHRPLALLHGRRRLLHERHRSRVSVRACIYVNRGELISLLFLVPAAQSQRRAPRRQSRFRLSTPFSPKVIANWPPKSSTVKAAPVPPTFNRRALRK